MKLVIEIDDNLYTRLFDNGVDNYDDAVDMAKAIRKGTPIPKGHGRVGDLDIILTWLVFKGIIDELKCGEVTSVFRKATIIEADEGE